MRLKWERWVLGWCLTRADVLFYPSSPLIFTPIFPQFPNQQTTSSHTSSDSAHHILSNHHLNWSTRVIFHQLYHQLLFWSKSNQFHREPEEPRSFFNRQASNLLVSQTMSFSRNYIPSAHHSLASSNTTPSAYQPWLQRKVTELEIKVNVQTSIITQLTQTISEQGALISDLRKSLGVLETQRSEKESEFNSGDAHTCPLDQNNNTSHEKLVEVFNSKINNLSSEIDQLQVQLRKGNLIFYGIEEDEMTPGQLFSKVQQIVREGMVPRRSLAFNCNFHTSRIGSPKSQPSANSRPRPVKVHFPNVAERNEVWKARFLLRGSQIAVSEDLPLSVRIQRAEQRKQNNGQLNSESHCSPPVKRTGSPSLHHSLSQDQGSTSTGSNEDFPENPFEWLERLSEQVSDQVRERERNELKERERVQGRGQDRGRNRGRNRGGNREPRWKV